MHRLSPPAPWPPIAPLIRLQHCKFGLPPSRSRRLRLGLCRAEMAMVGSRTMTSPEAIASSWDGNAVHGDTAEKMPSPTQGAPLEVALNQMSKWLVSGSLATAALWNWKHDAEIMWVLAGAVVNTLLSSLLKKMFNHA
ncbi:hypothetical protein ACP70R_029338 [Stipagrostis hirtigluma subsp. patula]